LYKSWIWGQPPLSVTKEWFPDPIPFIKTPSVLMVAKIVKALGVPIEELL
jgi:hypothetical protein